MMKRFRAIGMTVAALLLVGMTGCGDVSRPAAEPVVPAETEAPVMTPAPSQSLPAGEVRENEPEERELIWVGISFEPSLSLEDGRAMVEESLGHSLDAVRLIPTANALSAQVTRAELELIRQLDGVRSAQEETLNEPGPGIVTQPPVMG